MTTVENRPPAAQTGSPFDAIRITTLEGREYWPGCAGCEGRGMTWLEWLALAGIAWLILSVAIGVTVGRAAANAERVEAEQRRNRS